MSSSGLYTGSGVRVLTTYPCPRSASFMFSALWPSSSEAATGAGAPGTALPYWFLPYSMCVEYCGRMTVAPPIWYCCVPLSIFCGSELKVWP